MASSVCGCEVFPAHAMNSFSLLPCRTSRPWHFEPSDHHRHGGAHRLPEIAHHCATSVRVEVAANHAAAKSNGPAQLSRFKTTQQHNANRKTYFLNSIGHERPIRDFRAMSACPPIATKSLHRGK